MAAIFFRELGRKIPHFLVLATVGLFVLLERSVSREIALFTLLFILLIFLALEYLRIELNVSLPFLSSWVRAKEERTLHGAGYFLMGAVIILAVLDLRIALAALLMAALGDMAAGIAGKQYGTTLLFKDKTLRGGLAEFITNVVVGLIVLHNIYIIILMAFTATVVETFVNDLEDNLYVPLFAGFVGQLLIYLI